LPVLAEAYKATENIKYSSLSIVEEKLLERQVDVLRDTGCTAAAVVKRDLVLDDRLTVEY